eukprot:31395-Pelagococcus_subviridis.AAC.1
MVSIALTITTPSNPASANRTLLPRPMTTAGTRFDAANASASASSSDLIGRGRTCVSDARTRLGDRAHTWQNARWLVVGPSRARVDRLRGEKASRGAPIVDAETSHRASPPTPSVQ